MNRAPAGNLARLAIAKGWRLLSVRAATLLLVVLRCGGGLSAYSLLTHEEIVDLLWSDEIRPLLLKRYPALSVAEYKVGGQFFGREEDGGAPR